VTTLISVHNSEGCVGRCDVRCYDATTPTCKCICGGMNHGAGKDKAMANTEEYAESMIESWGLKEGEVWKSIVQQRSLFETKA
jgi:hypothetical protein